jgi:cell division septal protein FtsQ
MRRRSYTSRRRRRDTEYRRRSVFMRPSVQITIILVAALVIFILLQSGGR